MVSDNPIEESHMSAIAHETGTTAPEAATEISSMRERIDQIDAALIALWKERAAISQQVGKTRVASGGTRLVLSREREIMDRFRAELGPDGTQLALLILRAGRGPL
ncbi:MULTISPECIES: chorismate mutase [Catellatospora]